ncbi:MAG TPA: hypothetical protein VKA81_11420, partial [Verrucomicrobiae bacterium]|nr:hypothetical protein [Verrucomicrobiae bacterium]
MKRKFDLIFRGSALALAALLLWSVRASAQTNPPISTPTTNNAAASAPAKGEKSGSKNYHGRLTFGLDKLEVLNTVTAFGEPLWKYLASLIYIFL